MIVRRQGLLDPVGGDRRQIPAQLPDRPRRVAPVSHPPPAVAVQHHAESGFRRLPDGLRDPEVAVGSGGRPELVGRKSQRLDGRRLGRVALGRHVHAGRAVALDPVPPASADKFRHGCAVGLRRCVDDGDLHGMVRLLRLERRLEAKVPPVSRVAALQEGPDQFLDLAACPHMGRSRRESLDSGIRRNPDQHGVALEDRAQSAVERQGNRCLEGAGHEQPLDLGDLHCEPRLLFGQTILYRGARDRWRVRASPRGRGRNSRASECRLRVVGPCLDEPLKTSAARFRTRRARIPKGLHRDRLGSFPDHENPIDPCEIRQELGVAPATAMEKPLHARTRVESDLTEEPAARL